MRKTKAIKSRRIVKPPALEITPQQELVIARKKLQNLRATNERLKKEIPGSPALKDISIRVLQMEKYIVKLEIEVAEQAKA